MLEALFGNKLAEKVLLFFYVYKSGYIREISYCFSEPVNGVNQQLKRFEAGSVLVSTLRGKVRIYEFNPRYAFLPELKALLEKAYRSLPEKDVKRYFMKRTRPRRAGKPV
ncbi:MAG: hypothetical protein A2044_05840 [Candidatus Firestonebacteria bacterium GWA2_43_8]|nr:MAG: hypothetical protein A2044_05840 [Candidatus Firestonebacteria bacterium GWA2_43_8]